MAEIEISEAEANFERLVDALESGLETEIILLRDGRPAARLLGAREPDDIGKAD